MPYKAANLPTVPYVLNIGSGRLLPEPIRGQSALSEVASTTSYGAMSSSVCGRPSGAVEQTVPTITYPETPQEVTESNKHSKSGGSKDDFLIGTYESPRVATDKGLKKNLT